jgi:hypothetical protein
MPKRIKTATTMPPNPMITLRFTPPPLLVEQADYDQRYAESDEKQNEGPSVRTLASEGGVERSEGEQQDPDFPEDLVERMRSWARSTILMGSPMSSTNSSLPSPRTPHRNDPQCAGSVAVWGPSVCMVPRSRSLWAGGGLRPFWVHPIKGNDYRLVIAVDFEKSIVWIKWLGTHREYDDLDAREVEHE